MEKEILILFLLLVSSSTLASCCKTPALFTFGDSIFDAGNNQFNKNCSVQANFYPYGSTFFHHPTGRFTNGRTIVDFISGFMGIGFQKPYLEVKMNARRRGFPSNGINFASGGSGLLRDTNQIMGVISLQEQLQQFKRLVVQNKISKTIVRKSIFALESGSNDMFRYFTPFDNHTLDSETYVQSMLTETTKFVELIYKLGARKIVLFSLGPLGCVPGKALLGVSSDKCFEEINEMVKVYNKKLERFVKEARKGYKFSGAIIVFGDVYRIVERFKALPAHYGFKDTSSACCGNGALGATVSCGTKGYKMCEKPNEFLFWDYVHPTEHTYKLLSKAFWGGKRPRIRPVNLKTLAHTDLPDL